MAYYKFDLDFINTQSWSSGADYIDMDVWFESMDGGFYEDREGPFNSTESFSFDTSVGDPGGDWPPPFEIQPEERVWVTIRLWKEVSQDPYKQNIVGAYALGPYIASEIGTEVPAP